LRNSHPGRKLLSTPSNRGDSNPLAAHGREIREEQGGISEKLLIRKLFINMVFSCLANF
jgi:hypothetical protein